MSHDTDPSKTEVVPKARRRSFSAKYKREVVQQAAACKAPGEIGAFLRREGLYSSQLAQWRGEVKEHDLAALSPKKRGPKGKANSPLTAENILLRRQLAAANARIERAELIIEVQKKVSMILGITLPKVDDDQ